MSTTTAQGIIWVCQDCMLAHANGEISDDRPADEPEVWARWADLPAGSVTMGADVHVTQWCTRENDGECLCETQSFSHAQCDGCGSYLAGDRYAFTWWA